MTDEERMMVRDLHRTIAALVLTAGGQVRITQGDMIKADTTSVECFRSDDGNGFTVRVAQ